MSADEVRAYASVMMEAYAAELRAHLRVSEEAARARAEASADQAFPDGHVAPGNWIYAVEDGEGERVGILWLGAPDARDTGVLWVLDVEIEPRHRGRGLGRDAMRLAEAEAQRLGYGRIKLNVFASNLVARALYRSLGYEEMSLQLTKEVGP